MSNSATALRSNDQICGETHASSSRQSLPTWHLHHSYAVVDAAGRLAPGDPDLAGEAAEHAAALETGAALRLEAVEVLADLQRRPVAGAAAAGSSITAISLAREVAAARARSTFSGRLCTLRAASSSSERAPIEAPGAQPGTWGS